MELNDEDATLMLAFQRGNTGAFEQLLDKYKIPIVNFIYKFVNNAAEAEDLAQDVFLRIYRARATYEPRARFAAWIYRIAANVALKAVKKARHSPFVFFRRPNERSEPDPVESLPDSAPNAEFRMVSAETGRLVRRAIQALPAKEKMALVLRRHEGLSYREIAEVMNCTEGAVKTYIHRGKLRVRDHILPYFKRGWI
jgi:RNA polymerase sigma-70 factor (ECF subfamily)